MLARLLVGTILLFSAAAALAQDAAQAPYDLETVIDTALARHPTLQAGAREISAAEARVRQVQAHFRPQINAEAGYMRLQEGPSFTVEGMGTMEFGDPDNWTANLGLELPLYTGGKLESMREAARAGVRMTELGLTRRRQTVAINAARAFYRLLEANRMLPVITAQGEALQEVVRVAEAMAAEGVVANIDAMRAQVALTGAQASLEQLQADRAAARAMLVEAMGLPPGTPVEIAESQDTATVPELTRDQWQAAWDSRPDLHAIEAQKRAAQAQINIARSESKPQVGFFARSEFERATFYPETGTLSGGIVIRQKVSDGGATRQAVAEAEAKLDQLQAVEEQVKYGIAVQVQVAISNLRSAQARIEMVTPAVTLAEEALRLTQIGYANGVIPLTDVLQAQAALTKARADYEGALSSRRQAAAEYDYAMGRTTGEAAP